jgi:dTDP-4-amino-4,6-dideoxygalactose transaminase
VQMTIHDIKLLIPDLPDAEGLLPYLQRVDQSRWYTNFGPLVRELEATLADEWPVSQTNSAIEFEPLHVVTLNTGTAPLELGIAALSLQSGSAVLLPAFNFPASAAAIMRNGLQPVFADVETDSWQLTPEIARAAARVRRLALVIPVATFGCPLDVQAWDAFVIDTGIPVLFDAAAAFGNQAVGRHVSVSFSLHATKPFGIGEGGLFVTRDAALAARVRRLSNFGFERGCAQEAATNAKLSELAAAVALAQWARWPDWWAARQCLWERYRDRLNALSLALQAGFGVSEVPATLVVNLNRPAASVANQLKDAGIETRQWYCPPLYRHPAYAHCDLIDIDGESESLRVTEQLSTQTLGIPWHNFLANEEIDGVLGVLTRALGKDQ